MKFTELQAEKKEQNNMNNINAHSLILISSIIARSIASIMYIFVAYKAYAEVGIKNGLIKLRRQLFVTSFILFFINIFGLVLVTIRAFTGVRLIEFLTDILNLLNSTGFLYVSFLLAMVYTQSYSKEGKEYHKRIDKMEKANNSLKELHERGVNK